MEIFLLPSEEKQSSRILMRWLWNRELAASKAYFSGAAGRCSQHFQMTATSSQGGLTGISIQMGMRRKLGGNVELMKMQSYML